MLKRSELSLESQSGGVTTTGVVEDDRRARAWLSEGGGEVKRNTDAAEFLARLRATVDDSRADTSVEIK